MPSVMIVRDEVLKLRLEGRLSAAGISDVALTVVANAMEALDRTRVEPPTVLVVTSALTGTTPPEFCTAVRGILGAASTKLLLVTGADQALLAQ
ncbi:MAG: hypothetical protein HY904_03345, partial [Deltaproteobacteria bacterium]|nr:hypothetical protein [Deltaproteobacteria bacterium]